MKILILILLTGFISSSEENLLTNFKDIPILGGIATITSDAKNYIKSKGKQVTEKVKSYFRGNQKYLEATSYMTTPKLISSNGYAAESHTLVTEDGYILEVHRIPYPKHSLSKSPQRTILLHHGILGSSADWVLAGPEKGLAYILSDAYYDVWMINARGNTYSRAHVSKDINSYSFWNFTFHEMGQYDLPAVIDYIIELKGLNVEINYVGFSMGTTVLFSLLSTKTDYNNVLNAAYGLAPVVYTSHMKSPIRLLAKYSNDMEYWMKSFGANEFLPSSDTMKWLAKYAYKIEKGAHKGMFLRNIFFMLCGYDEEQFNRTLVPAILNHIPAGTSTKTLIHYAQEIENEGEFQQFDYGYERNVIHYGNAKPPKYQMDKVTVPVALISADNDWLSAHEDVQRLFNELPNTIEHFKVPNKHFNHIDFLFGIDAPTLVFDKLLELLHHYGTSQSQDSQS